MKNVYILIFNLFIILFSTNSFSQTYSYDFNPKTKIARLYTNNEIIVEYNLKLETALANQYEFSNGYVYKKVDNEWIKMGFYNSNEIIYDKISYKLKTNLLSRVFIKKESDKNWTKIKISKNQISFESKPENLPEAVQYFILIENLKNKCEDELEILRKQRVKERLERKEKTVVTE